jgi:uncharacterized repeat protein (TIGR01451 family)
MNKMLKNISLLGALLVMIGAVGMVGWLETQPVDASCVLTPEQVKAFWNTQIIPVLNGRAGVVTYHNKTDCSFPASVAAFKVHTPGTPTAPFGHQTPFSQSSVITVPARSSVTISTSVPSCNFQIDYFYGGLPARAAWDRHILAGFIYRDMPGGFCPLPATPAPQAAVTPTPTPTATPTPVITKGLDVTKTDEREVTRPGHSLTYTIKVTNTGNAKLEDVKLTDTVPSQIDVTGISDGGSREGRVITWSNIVLSAGESKTVTFTARVKSDTTHGAELFNEVWARSADNNLTDSAIDTTRVEREPQVKAIVAPTPVPVPVTAKTGANLITLVSTLLGAAGMVTVGRKLF